MVAVENNHQAAVRRLCKAGAALSGANGQLHPNNLGVLELKLHESTYQPQHTQHVFEMCWILQYRGLRSRPTREVLPQHLVLRILEEARYWLRVTASDTRNEEYDADRTTLNSPFVLSPSLPRHALSTVREVLISICSHDQGWSIFKKHHGTYEGSNTWFDVAIQKANGEWLDLDGEDRLICRTIHASDKRRTHSVVFGKQQPATTC